MSADAISEFSSIALLAIAMLSSAAIVAKSRLKNLKNIPRG